MIAWSTLLSAFTRLTPDDAHFIALHGDLGYSALLHDITGLKPSSGLNANMGFDYRIFHNNFIFSVGVEGMYGLSLNSMEELDVQIPMRDTEGELFDMHVHVDKSRDMAQMVNLNIPLLFGGEWKRFYFMVGPKVSLNLYGSTTSQAEVTTYGGYDKYYDDFYDMPNHQFASDQYMGSATLPLKWNFNVMAHVELGARIGHMFKHKQFRLNPDLVRMYIAAYVDFGLFNIHVPSSGSPMFEYRETDQGVQFYVQPLMLSNIADNAVFRNMNIGVKYTVAFELPRKGKSYIYDSEKYSRPKIKRGGNQSIKN